MRNRCDDDITMNREADATQDTNRYLKLHL